MAEHPLLAMPSPERIKPSSGGWPREKISPVSPDRQAVRIGPKFRRLERALADPKILADMRDDPAAIVPERALVFELSSQMVDFYRAIRRISGLEFLGEDEDEKAPDEDFFVMDAQGRKTDKQVSRRLYFTIPDRSALDELVGLWKRCKRGEELGHGLTEWKKVFNYLDDIRPWGPEDRLTEDAIADWRERLESYPDKPVRFEVEFWYRSDANRREKAKRTFIDSLDGLGGRLIDSAVIEQIRYHAALVEMAPGGIRELLENPEIGLVTVDDIMWLRPQSMVSGPVEVPLVDSTRTKAIGVEGELEPPIAALLDGMPMALHDQLADRLVVEDPDGFAARYATAREQRHGTAMASLILHGDLNAPNRPPPVESRLYVRPVMYPQAAGFDSSYEALPQDQLGIDLIWRAFIRMFEGEGSVEPTASTVQVVNLSLGDSKRRFAGTMSPWARLLDYLSWEYKVLILVSAGNISDYLLLENTEEWADFENADEEERQAEMLRSILRQRAKRQILSPAESVNALTIGAAHSDYLAPSGHGALAVDPYVNPHLPNPSSALGMGFKRAIKPEILLPGGAEQVRANKTQAPIDVRPVDKPGGYFGVGVASPGPSGETDRKLNMSGTSVSTALATHNAIRILESLSELSDDPVHPTIDPEYHPVLLKALLVHSACWNEDAVIALKDIINEDGNLYWEHQRDEISRFVGFGCPDIARVIDCSESRATLIGWNTIKARETDQFRIPLPVELEGIAGFRALSVTIAWLTPITYKHRMYRLAKFGAGPGSDKGFSIGVGNSKNQPSHNVLGKGTVYHHRWEGRKAAEFVDGGYLALDATCLPAAGDFDESIPYAVAASLEVGEEVSVSVYESIRDRLKQDLQVRKIRR